MLLGLSASLFGGFIAATSSKIDNIASSAFGLIVAIIFIPQFIGGNLRTPAWDNIISIILVLPASYWGGFLAIKYKKAKDN